MEAPLTPLAPGLSEEERLESWSKKLGQGGGGKTLSIVVERFERLKCHQNEVLVPIEQPRVESNEINVHRN